MDTIKSSFHTFSDYWSYNQSAITSEDREEYIKQYSKPGAMCTGFEYYRAVFDDLFFIALQPT